MYFSPQQPDYLYHTFASCLIDRTEETLKVPIHFRLSIVRPFNDAVKKE